jgi:membrane protein YqaA with SNARE-associated domain
MLEWLKNLQAEAALTPLGLYLVTYLVCFVSGLVPLVNTEAYLLSVSAISRPASALPLTLAAALGQMTAKTLIYCSGRGLLRLPTGRYRARIDSTQARLDANRGHAGAFMFVSAFAGLPPFYLVSFVAGTLRLRAAYFVVAGLLGRFLRFGLLVLLPQLVRLWA